MTARAFKLGTQNRYGQTVSPLLADAASPHEVQRAALRCMLLSPGMSFGRACGAALDIVSLQGVRERNAKDEATAFGGYVAANDRAAA